MERAKIESAARSAIAPLVPARKANDLSWGQRTDAGRLLPPYYFVYFLLVELLGFRHFGQGEKVAWSVPIEFEGCLLTIEHRKFGLGVFSDNVPANEPIAEEVVKRINAGVKAAEPFFDYLADTAAGGSRLGVCGTPPILGCSTRKAI